MSSVPRTTVGVARVGSGCSVLGLVALFSRRTPPATAGKVERNVEDSTGICDGVEVSLPFSTAARVEATAVWFCDGSSWEVVVAGAALVVVSRRPDSPATSETAEEVVVACVVVMSRDSCLWRS